MPRYLAVAHRTATSPELVECARAIAAEEPGTRFTILVPASDQDGEGGDAESSARRLAADARQRFEHAGLRVEEALIGDPSPMRAIEEEMRRNPGIYREIILCMPPPGISRWLGMDVYRRVARKSDLPVIRVIGQPAMAGTTG